MDTCSYQHPSDAELASVIKMKMSLPVISSATASSSLHHHHSSNRASIMQLAQQHLPKSDIGNAVAKVLQGYDWSLVPLASRWILRFKKKSKCCSLLFRVHIEKFYLFNSLSFFVNSLFFFLLSIISLIFRNFNIFFCYFLKAAHWEKEWATHLKF